MTDANCYGWSKIFPSLDRTFHRAVASGRGGAPAGMRTVGALLLLEAADERDENYRDVKVLYCFLKKYRML